MTQHHQCCCNFLWNYTIKFQFWLNFRLLLSIIQRNTSRPNDFFQKWTKVTIDNRLTRAALGITEVDRARQVGSSCNTSQKSYFHEFWFGRVTWLDWTLSPSLIIHEPRTMKNHYHNGIFISRYNTLSRSTYTCSLLV